MQAIDEFTGPQAQNAHVTPHLTTLSDDRFPGWIFTIERCPVVLGFRCVAHRGGTWSETRPKPTALEALEAAQDDVRGFLAELLAYDVAVRP